MARPIVIPYTVLVLLCSGSALASDKALVDCSDKQFKSGSSAKSLMGWSNRRYKQAEKAKGTGVYPERVCTELVRQRGDAHCQQLANADYRKALSDGLALCNSLRPASAAEAPAVTPDPAAAAAAAAAAGPVPVSGKPLVDCSDKRFESGNSAKSLMGWSNEAFKAIEKAKGTGLYPEDFCKGVITQRGGAHCKQPKDVQISQALQAVLTLCHQLKNPAAATGKMLVKCADKRFQRRKSVPVMVQWSLSITARLDEWNSVQAKAKCADALAYAGSAHCMLPNEEGPKEAIQSVKGACKADRTRRANADRASKAASAKSRADAKANRKILKFPRSTFKGASRALSKQMKAAMLAGGVARAKNEVVKAVPMGSWQEGRYRVTKQPYRKVNGVVLWHDSDKDGVCRFTSYKFVQDKVGSRWGKLRFKAFCLGCAEGWTKCK